MNRRKRLWTPITRMGLWRNTFWWLSMKLVVRLFSKGILSADTMSQMNCIHCDSIPHNVNITSNFFIEIENWFSAKLTNCSSNQSSLLCFVLISQPSREQQNSGQASIQNTSWDPDCHWSKCKKCFQTLRISNWEQSWLLHTILDGFDFIGTDRC